MNAESADMDRISADGLYRLLLSGYGEPRWWSDDPFMVMVQAILVQNTAWRNVEKATAIIGNMMTPVKLYHLHKVSMSDYHSANDLWQHLWTGELFLIAQRY